MSLSKTVLGQLIHPDACPLFALNVTTENDILILFVCCFAVIQSLIALVNDPQPEHPLRADLAEEYSKDRKKFLKNAEEFTKKHGEKRPMDWAPDEITYKPHLTRPIKCHVSVTSIVPPLTRSSCSPLPPLSSHLHSSSLPMAAGGQHPFASRTLWEPDSFLSLLLFLFLLSHESPPCPSLMLKTKSSGTVHTTS